MAGKYQDQIGQHGAENATLLKQAYVKPSDTLFKYKFENFFHPFVGELIEALNNTSLSGLLDATFHEALRNDTSHNPAIGDVESNVFFFNNFNYGIPQEVQQKYPLVQVKGLPKEIDVSPSGSYANYNWELLFHIPLTIAVHLSKNQRFAEAQRWFHYIFDPTCNDMSIPKPERYWKFLGFRKKYSSIQIDEILQILSIPRSDLSPAEQLEQDSVLNGYIAILNKPFRPHAVARTRYLAYQYCVVMKYLDNLIAWGDHLFRQDTMESINEATQIYVLAANILGERPQRIPPGGTVKPKTFKQLKDQGLGPIGNAIVELEGQFPFNFGLPQTQGVDPNVADSLFGIGPALYFCTPRNEKLLGYWDTVGDRLFKIRHCMSIEGAVRQIALFDPPIDPGMLVKAVAAGIDIGSIISGLNQPTGSVRSLFLIQKALELADEVRGLGSALLSAIEKSDGEHMALLRQGHEIKIQQMTQEVRFLQWKQAQESTESLLRGRASTLERYYYYQRLLGMTPDKNTSPDIFSLDRREMSEENFDETYAELIGQYDKTIQAGTFGPLRLAGGTSPANQSGATGKGTLVLNTNEDAELSEHAPASRDLMHEATVSDAIGKASIFLPDIKVNIHYWGVGSTQDIPIGELFARGASIASNFQNTGARIHDNEGNSASKTASYERRADEWILQNNLAARELMQVGRQILGSLIVEQIAHHDYLNVKKQIEQSQEVDQFLHEKFTNEELYAWMQGEISRLYYENYRFAFDTARKAEQTMKRELMRSEVDTADFVKFNYWDSGRKGLLSGEALYLDVKRMEMAYHENNKREYELTKHVSLRQLNPFALLTLRATGSCEVTVSEWLFDMDTPGHYMRRIKNVSLSIPSVTGPFTSVNCTLTLLKSSLRKSSLLKDDEYARQGSEDDRFVDYFGAIQSIVTSSGNDDSGMFETSLRDERFLPFEGAGVYSNWKLELPAEFRQFDYNTISDVILHIRYTARQGGALLRQKAVEHLRTLVEDANTSGLVQLFSLKHDFPGEWHRFSMPESAADFTATVKQDYFPYFTRGRNIAIGDNDIQIFAIQGGELKGPSSADLGAIELTDTVKEFELPLPESEILTRNRDAQVFVVIKYALLPA